MRRFRPLYAQQQGLLATERNRKLFKRRVRRTFFFRLFSVPHPRLQMGISSASVYIFQVTSHPLIVIIPRFLFFYFRGFAVSMMQRPRGLRIRENVLESFGQCKLSTVHVLPLNITQSLHRRAAALIDRRAADTLDGRQERENTSERGCRSARLTRYVSSYIPSVVFSFAAAHD